MGIESVKSKGRQSEVYDNYFMFPIRPVGLYELFRENDVREFTKIHTRLLKWAWLVYATDYITDIKALDSTPDRDFESWLTTWQKAVEKCKCSIDIMAKLMLILQIVAPGQIEEYDSQVMADMTMVRPDEQESDKQEPLVVNCRGLTQTGTVCKKRQTDNGFWKIHQGQR